MLVHVCHIPFKNQVRSELFPIRWNDKSTEKPIFQTFMHCQWATSGFLCFELCAFTEVVLLKTWVKRRSKLRERHSKCWDRPSVGEKGVNIYSCMWCETRKGQWQKRKHRVWFIRSFCCSLYGIYCVSSVLLVDLSATGLPKRYQIFSCSFGLKSLFLSARHAGLVRITFTTSLTIINTIKWITN